MIFPEFIVNTIKSNDDVNFLFKLFYDNLNQLQDWRNYRFISLYAYWIAALSVEYNLEGVYVC